MSKRWTNSKVKVTGKKSLYSQESLVNKNTYIKIKALGLTAGKILARLKFIEKICHGHFGKDVSTLGKVLSQEILK